MGEIGMDSVCQWRVDTSTNVTSLKHFASREARRYGSARCPSHRCFRFYTRFNTEDFPM